MENQYRIIETAAEFEELVTELESEPIIAVDLEADSMHHFKEKVCLLQLATSKTSAIIDPLVLNDLSALKPVFADPKIKKVFHGADYDVRSLYRDFEIDVHHLFDTQLASMFMGIKETGLDAVLQSRFAVKLDKKFQRKDWSIRPLPEEMMAYAAKDTTYLMRLAEELAAELKASNRFYWVEEECALLSRVRPPLNDGNPLFLKCKGAGKLRRIELAVLEELLKFRRDIAERKDRPLFKVFGTGSLIKIATRGPRSVKSLERLGALSPRQVSMYGADIVSAVKKGFKVSPDRLPVYPRQKAPKLPPQVPDRIKTLKDWRDKKAAVLGLEPPMIFTKAQMTAVAIERPRSIEAVKTVPDLKNWQKKEFGREIAEVLKKAK
jgi:ribonuclease D